VIGKEEGLDRVLTFDMGGTTAKLGAIDGGEPAIAPTFEVDQVRYRKGSGLPINVPAVELLEIGAGGGSIAHTDMGLIKVGPESAGADPGPVCYGRGGERPTVTDANVVLGYINPDYFNGGAMRLDAQAAADAGQGHEIRVDLPDFPVRSDYAAQITARFEEAYQKKYGYRQAGALVEAVDWYVVATVANATKGSHRAKSWKGQASEHFRRGTRK